MGTPKLIRRYTPAEYYRLEAEADYKSEYFDGEIFKMTGASQNHNRICINLGGELRAALKGKPCEAYPADMRLKVIATGLRTYPDASVYCGAMEFDPEDPSHQTLTNPTALFEVLSPTTENYDRGKKSSHYRRIESLQILVLVSQDMPRVEAYFRQSNGMWGLTELEGMDQVLPLPAIDAKLSLVEVYDRVDFTQSQTTAQPE
jgi:Uma2 family endonuclease